MNIFIRPALLYDAHPPTGGNKKCVSPIHHLCSKKHPSMKQNSLGSSEHNPRVSREHLGSEQSWSTGCPKPQLLLGKFNAQPTCDELCSCHIVASHLSQLYEEQLFCYNAPPWPMCTQAHGLPCTRVHRISDGHLVLQEANEGNKNIKKANNEEWVN